MLCGDGVLIEETRLDWTIRIESQWLDKERHGRTHLLLLPGTLIPAQPCCASFPTAPPPSSDSKLMGQPDLGLELPDARVKTGLFSP